jgi:hypothetical protein
MVDCELCVTAAKTGWWGRSGITHCLQCHRTWQGYRQQHCTECHRHFSGETAASAHRKSDRCMSDRSLDRKGLYKTRDKFGDLWRHKPSAEPWGSWQTDESGG